MKIADLKASGRWKDIYLLARYMYRIGKPFLEDKVFDSMEKILLKNGVITQELHDRSYDDDPVPYNLLRELNLEKYIVNFGSYSPYARYLDEEKSLSINPLFDYSPIFEYFQSYRHLELIVSLKVDGINSKNLYLNGDLMLSLSRARAGEGIDFTKNISNILPIYTDISEKEVKVFCENYVDADYLEVLRSKYDPTSYKTCRTSATSLLRVTHASEDYKHLHSLAFGAEGLPYSTISATLDYLKSQGFETVPYMILKPNTVPDNYDKFVEFIKAIGDKFMESTLDIPSDGLVVDINDLTHVGVVSGKYSDRNIALKIHHWSSKYYKGIIKNIILEQKAVNASCRVEIEPMLTNDGCEARIVNVHNPRILIENGYTVGSEVYYERQSGTINTLLYGERLKAALDGRLENF